MSKEATNWKAQDEIDEARLNLAKAVNKALEDGIGDRGLTKITILSAAIERVREDE